MSNENLIKCVELIRRIQAGEIALAVVEKNKLQITPIEHSTEIAPIVRSNPDVVRALLTGVRQEDSYATVKRARQTKPSCPQLLGTGSPLPECLYCPEWYPWLKDGQATGLCVSRRALGDGGILNGGERE